MRLSVRHTTCYRFDAPRQRVWQSHRLRPSLHAGQRVLNWQVTTPGGTEGARFTDGAGDDTCLVSLSGPVDSVTTEVAGEVETSDLAGVLRGHRERVPPLAYLRATRATRPTEAIRDLAGAAVRGIDAGATLERAHALAGAVQGAVAYRPGTTHPQTSAGEALAAGEGVCQDHAHVLISAALACDLPARYVAGYLFSAGTEAVQGAEATGGPDAEAVAAQGEASHGWVEIHVPDLGWVGFDASNGCCPDARYIRLCSGYDAFDAAPIRGHGFGVGPETLDVTVAVSTVQQ